MNGKIRILIADDHPVVRQGLATLFGSQEDFELVAEAANGQEAIDKAHEVSPDVIIIDLKMPGKDGLIAIREISRDCPGTRLIVLAGYAEDEQVAAAITSGADGFLLKDADPGQLIEAIRAVYRGSNVLHPGMARRLSLRQSHLGEDLLLAEPLTARELDVLRLLAHGMSNREIASELFLTHHTVMTHVRNILHKLNLPNRTRAAIYACEHGLS